MSYKGTFVKPQKHLQPVERFFSYVSPEPNTGCWLWAGCSDKNGYGLLRVEGRNERAHRFSYKLHKGDIPADMLVCHKCDTPACVNPDHMFLGDNSANQIDSVRKYRSFWQILTVDEVREIKSLAASGRRPIDLARQFGVSASLICNIKSGAKWAHVDNA